jgi:hypothetical protein
MREWCFSRVSMSFERSRRAGWVKSSFMVVALLSAVTILWASLLFSCGSSDSVGSDGGDGGECAEGGECVD